MVVAEAPSTIARRGAPRTIPRWILGALILAELVAWYAVLKSGGWAYDDNMWIEMAHMHGFTGSWLTSDLFGHWAVGYTAAFSGVDALMPMDYRWVLFIMLLGLGVSVLLLVRIMERLFADRGTALLAGAYLGLSVLLIRSLEWFSQGLQTVPTLLFDLLCLWAYLRYMEQPRMRWIAVSAGAIAAGLVFYEKPVFMPFYLLVLQVLVFTRSPRQAAKTLWRDRALWVSYGVVLVAYAVAREAVGAGSTGAGPMPSIGHLFEALWLMWAKSLIPGLFGLALPSSHVDSVQLAIGCILQVIVFSAIAVSVWRRRSAWRAWAALAIFVIATWLLVSIARVGVLGPEAATDQRYLIDFAWLVPLLVTAAFSARGRMNVPPMTISTARLRPPVAVAACVGLAAYMSISIATAVNWQDGWGGTSARVWEHNVERGLAAFGRSGRPVTIADNLAPVYVVQPSFVPYSYLSLILPEYGRSVTANGPVRGAMTIVDGSGQLHPAKVARVVATFPQSACRTSTSAPGLALRGRVRVPPDPTTGPYYLRVRYRTSAPAKLPVFVDYGSGFGGAPEELLVVTPTSRESLVWLGAGSPHGVQLTSPASYVCVQGMDIIALAAAS